MLDDCVESFARTNDLDGAPGHKYLGRKRRRVVSAGHAHTVGTSGEDGEQIAAFKICWKHAIKREEITGLAERTDNVLWNRARELRVWRAAHGHHGLAGRDRPNEVETPVVRGSEQRVHARITDDEALLARSFCVEHFQYEYSGIGNNRATGLKDEADATIKERFRNRKNRIRVLLQRG